MRTDRDELIDDLELTIKLLKKTKDELYKLDDGWVRHAYSGQYSLEKVKRNCIVARELILGVRKGCENVYD